MSHTATQSTWDQLDRHRFCGTFSKIDESTDVYCSMDDYSALKTSIEQEKMRMEQYVREQRRSNSGTMPYSREFLSHVTSFGVDPQQGEFPIVFKIGGTLFSPKTHEKLRSGQLMLPKNISESSVFVEVPRPTIANMRYMNILQ